MKLLPGVETPLAGRGPDDIDFVVVREIPGLYCGVGGYLKKELQTKLVVGCVYAKRLRAMYPLTFEYTRRRNSLRRR